MKLIFILVFLTSFLISQEVDLGKWDKNSFNKYLTKISTKSQKEKALDISSQFLQTPYKANVLVGSKKQKRRTNNKSIKTRLLYFY